MDKGVSLRDRAGRASPEPASSLGHTATIANARKRNWRGQFVKKMRPSGPEERVWLIWSKKWRRWHCRSESSGGACGYTDDITRAGLFPRAKASEYNDGWDNTVFHVSEKKEALERELARMKAKVLEFEQAVERATPHPHGETQ